MATQSNKPIAERVRGLLEYNPETGLFRWRIARGGLAGAGSIAGRADSKGHLQISVDGKRYMAHRLAWLHFYGDWPDKEIDHIDGCKTNNAISNLRDVSHAENMQNQRKARSDNKTSGLLGVHWHKHCKLWTAQIRVEKKSYHLGYFDSAELAHESYLQAKQKMHPFGTLDFQSS